MELRLNVDQSVPFALPCSTHCLEITSLVQPHSCTFFPEASGSPWKKRNKNNSTRLHNCPSAWAFYNHTSTETHIWELIELWNIIFYMFMYSIYTVNSFFLGGGPSEVEKVDKILRRQWRGAAVGVVGRARVICVLREEKQTARGDKFRCFSFSFAVFISGVSDPNLLWSSWGGGQRRSPSRKGCGSVCRGAACRCTALCGDNSGSAWSTSSSTPGDPCRTPSGAFGSKEGDVNQSTAFRRAFLTQASEERKLKREERLHYETI